MSESLVMGREAAPERALRQRLRAERRDGLAPALQVRWARHEDEVRQAQRLRYQVFAGEMGARLSPPAGTPEGLDADAFDPHCEHLLVHAPGSAGAPPRLVGTYRVLMPSAARRLGGCYSDTEFDLGPLKRLRPYMAELGRSCVDPEFRTGGVILALWSALAEFMNANGVAAVFGCASVPMADGGHAAASLWRRLDTSHGVPATEQVHPRLRLPIESLRQDIDAEPPALVKGYLKCGARLLGAPAWDPDFNVADLPLLLRLSDLPDSYRRRFLA